MGAINLAINEADRFYMTEALRLAELGRGRTSPNPMVGAVVVKDDRIIGAGYHTKAGAPHAEIEAFRAAQELLAGATLYVTLEPCGMFGRTPPCTEAIIKAGIRRVVAAMVDPDPRVSGKGLQQLRAAGLEVEVGILEEQARRLNEAFIKHRTTGRPFVIAKFAMSLDGKIATRTGDSKYLTNAQSRAYVHKLRDQVDAIMVGAGTIRADDPLLTTRLPEGGGHNPLRVVLDTQLSLSPTANIVTTTAEAPTLIFTGEQADPAKMQQFRAKGVDIQPISTDDNGRVELRQALSHLAQRGILSVLLEGGAELNGAAFHARLVDKVLVFIAPLIIGGKDARSPVEGAGSATLREALRVAHITTQRFENDILIEGYL